MYCEVLELLSWINEFQKNLYPSWHPRWDFTIDGFTVELFAYDITDVEINAILTKIKEFGFEVVAYTFSLSEGAGEEEEPFGISFSITAKRAPGKV